MTLRTQVSGVAQRLCQLAAFAAVVLATGAGLGLSGFPVMPPAPNRSDIAYEDDEAVTECRARRRSP